ncbi:MAG TPA: PilZ domain-containing protein [Blastocatellia bacterium]|nr:PilZ domain-containing protein [Blastocatellia bacterium]
MNPDVFEETVLPENARSESSPEFSGDRRRFKRVPVFRPVIYFAEKVGEIRSSMLDLSEGGAYIESPVVAKGTEIEIQFTLASGHTVRVKAIARHVILGAGMGVEFQNLNDEDRAQIAAFVNSFRVPVATHAGRCFDESVDE